MFGQISGRPNFVVVSHFLGELTSKCPLLYHLQKKAQKERYSLCIAHNRMPDDIMKLAATRNVAGYADQIVCFTFLLNTFYTL